MADFKKRHEKESPAALERLQQVALGGGNIFAELMNTVRSCSLGQITQALYAVGGQYRRNMWAVVPLSSIGNVKTRYSNLRITFDKEACE